jgi:glyoxalase family protein
MSQLRTAGIHHITLFAADASRTLAFYRDMLGMTLVKRAVLGNDSDAHHLQFGDSDGSPGTLVTVLVQPHAARGRWGIGGVHHFALGTKNDETQLEWKRWLIDRGIRVSGPFDRGYFSSIYLADPDGQILEIATRGPGYGIDEPMSALGREMQQPAANIVIGGRDEKAIAARVHPEPVAAISSDMVLEGIHHVSAITDDLERAGAFYEEALGLDRGYFTSIYFRAPDGLMLEIATDGPGFSTHESAFPDSELELPERLAPGQGRAPNASLSLG